MNLNVNQLLNSLSFTLDCVESDLMQNVTNHGRRVAFIAARMGRALELSDQDLFDLISYSLMHDNGVTKSLLQAKNDQDYFQVELNRLHCIEGEKNIRLFPFFKNIPNVILYHHEHYDGSGFFSVAGENIPLFSRIIALADFVAIEFSEHKSGDDIISTVRGVKRYFDPILCEVLFEQSKNIEFWLNMNDAFISQGLDSLMPNVFRKFSYREIRLVSKIFSNIIDAKSPFTGSHSRGISEKTGVLCKYYEYDDDTSYEMRIAADLHDLGKLMIPNGILDKPASLTFAEIRTVQSHPFYTRRALKMINGFDRIADWAANHHEKLNGKGYPYGLTGDQLDYNSRLLGCVDIYQALTEDRPYRKALTHQKAVAIMNDMAKNGLIEKTVVQDINDVFADQFPMAATS